MRPETPVDVAFVRHRLVDEIEEAAVVVLQGLARGNGVGGIVGRGVLAKRVEVGQHALGPVRDAVVDGSGAFPFAGGRRLVEQFLELIVEARIEAFRAARERLL